MARQKRLGLALGGGAARGLAHLGVLKVLEETGIKASVVSGTSAGSIVAALYAGGYTWDTIAEVTRALDWGDFVQPVFPKMGLVRADRLERRLADLLGERTIEELEIPFRAVTVDLLSGTEHVIDSGSVAHAVRASCSIPGIFEPVRSGERLLVDGGVLNGVPSDVCFAMGADLVLAVDLNGDLNSSQEPENIFGVMLLAFSVMARSCRRRHTPPEPGTMITVTPNLSDFSYYNMKRLEELMQRGEQAMREQMPALLRLLKKHGIFG